MYKRPQMSIEEWEKFEKQAVKSHPARGTPEQKLVEKLTDESRKKGTCGIQHHMKLPTSAESRLGYRGKQVKRANKVVVILNTIRNTLANNPTALQERLNFYLNNPAMAEYVGPAMEKYVEEQQERAAESMANDKD